MCGIVGTFHYRGGVPDLALLARQRDRMGHRGPDDRGLESWTSAALAHRRLSIVDLSAAGHQPMGTADGRFWITFNGEIYEHARVRESLIARGHAFSGRSDTEVLLHSIEAGGEVSNTEHRGMFAYALFDTLNQRLVLVRDRLGIKPLYYHDDGHRIAFASELGALMLDPAIPRDLDEVALAQFLASRYIPSPRTIWRTVRKLPAGHRLTCDAAGARVEPYWSLPSPGVGAETPAQAAATLRNLLSDSVRVRMVADVPVGAFLSGGLDSSAVVAWMTRHSSSRVRTFTVGFEEPEYSELEDAARIARHLGTEHEACILGAGALDEMPALAAAMGEPFADASLLPTFVVSRLAGSRLRVVLSGDGGDEIFGGYKSYVSALRHERLNLLPPVLRRALGSCSGLLPPDHHFTERLRRIPMSALDRHLAGTDSGLLRCASPLLSSGLRERLLGIDPFEQYRERYRASLPNGSVQALLRADAGQFLVDDVLHKVDIASMLNSVEVRCPLLDHPLVEFVAAQPLDRKLRGGTTKWLLREAVKDMLPEAVLAGGKRGFNVPLDRWAEGRLGTLAREILLDDRARRRGWLDPAEVEHLLSPRSREHGGGRGQLIWSLTCLELWAQAHLDPGPPLISA